MRRSLRSVFFGLALSSVLLASPGAQQTAAPLHVVLIVDSSTAMASMINEFRAGLTAFVDALPPDAETAFISTGGQLRVRVPPGTDRERLTKAVSGFAQDGGANSFLETLLEADKRFMKPATGRRQVYVVLTTDSSTRGELPIDDYNKFMNDFRRRGGRAHAVVVRGNTMGTASEILGNLTQNTSGTMKVVAVATGLKDTMRELAERIVGGA
jgi:hypothetical protein